VDPTIAHDLGASEDVPYLSSCGGRAGDRSLSFEPLICPATPPRLPDDTETVRRLAELYVRNSTELLARHDRGGRVIWCAAPSPASTW